jgi:hypothetical protein
MLKIIGFHKKKYFMRFLINNFVEVLNSLIKRELTDFERLDLIKLFNVFIFLYNKKEGGY